MFVVCTIDMESWEELGGPDGAKSMAELIAKSTKTKLICGPDEMSENKFCFVLESDSEDHARAIADMLQIMTTSVEASMSISTEPTVKGIVTEIDNRDDTTTTLKVVVQDRDGTICYVDVSATELFLNLIENHPGGPKVKHMFDELCGILDQAMDEALGED